MDAIRRPTASTASRAKRWTLARPLLYVLAGVVLTLFATSKPEGMLRIVTNILSRRRRDVR